MLGFRGLLRWRGWKLPGLGESMVAKGKDGIAVEGSGGDKE